MSGSDANQGIVQAFREPGTGQTVTVTTVPAGSAVTVLPLARPGWYQVNVPVGAGACRYAAGLHATAAATAADRPRSEGIDYTFLRAGDTLAVYDPGAGGNVISLTLMPE